MIDAILYFCFILNKLLMWWPTWKKQFCWQI